MVTTRPPKTIVKPTALGPVANTDTKLLIYGLFQKGRVLAQDGVFTALHFSGLASPAHRDPRPGTSLRTVEYRSTVGGELCGTRVRREEERLDGINKIYRGVWPRGSLAPDYFDAGHFFLQLARAISDNAS